MCEWQAAPSCTLPHKSTQPYSSFHPAHFVFLTGDQVPLPRATVISQRKGLSRQSIPIHLTRQELRVARVAHIALRDCVLFPSESSVLDTPTWSYWAPPSPTAHTLSQKCLPSQASVSWEGCTTGIWHPHLWAVHTQEQHPVSWSRQQLERTLPCTDNEASWWLWGRLNTHMPGSCVLTWRIFYEANRIAIGQRQQGNSER